VKIGTPVSYHRPAHMSSLLAEVIPLAFAAAISPVVFLLQLNTLTGPRPLARGSALTAGAAIVLIVGSTLGVLLGGTGFSDRPTLQAVINIAFGVLLILVGLRALLRPPKPKDPSLTRSRRASVARSSRARAAWRRTSRRSRSTSRRSR
jgi:uncharacterized membrane protein YfcA